MGPTIIDYEVNTITTTSFTIKINKYPITNLANNWLKKISFLIGIFDTAIYNKTT